MTKGLFTDDSQRHLARTVSDLAHCNPFLPERLELERQALGTAHVAEDADWNRRSLNSADHPNVQRLFKRCTELVDAIRPADPAKARRDADWPLYEDVVLFVLYHRYYEHVDQTVERGIAGGRSVKVKYFDRYAADFEHYLGPADITPELSMNKSHVLACFFQIRRAFRQIFRYLVGASGPTVRLRAAIWQSIFTHDMRRYRRTLFERMGDITTLITGPSGSGKELVARAIGRSRYIPFDPNTGRFTEDFAGSFHALNVSALAPTLVESELFGHRRGAFTGAVGDRAGWLEQCPPLGTVFLDEIGDLDQGIQVKLLRVLQDRTFQRLGDTEDRLFEGKIIAATNRDLVEAMDRGTFRTDFYYRLCADHVETYPLRDQLDDRPDDLGDLLQHIARRMIGDEGETLAKETARWVDQRMPADYAWPGNVRELEQCVRNVMIRNAYQPRPSATANGWRAVLSRHMLAGDYTADQVLQQYCTLVYAKAGSYEAAARRLDLDRRTVKAKIDPDLLARIRGEH